MSLSNKQQSLRDLFPTPLLMKKLIHIEGEALVALNSIINTTSYPGRTEARKVFRASQCIAESVKEYQKDILEVETPFLEEFEEKEGGRKMKRVNPEKVEEYSEAMKIGREKKYEVFFDVETFGLVNGMVDGVFDRKEISEQGGLVGVDQARNLDQISIAFESARDVE